MTEYVVLERDLEDTDVPRWQEQVHITARSARAAVNAYTNDNGLDSGQFVAVPVRSWNPLALDTEPEPRRRLTALT